MSTFYGPGGHFGSSSSSSTMTDIDRICHMVQLITRGRPVETVLAELRKKTDGAVPCRGVTDLDRLSLTVQLITRGRPLSEAIAELRAPLQARRLLPQNSNKRHHVTHEPRRERPRREPDVVPRTQDVVDVCGNELQPQPSLDRGLQDVGRELVEP